MSETTKSTNTKNSDEADSADGNPEEVLTDHSYDGIQEYDNPLPGWWVWLFVASVAFSIFYWMYFHSGVEGRSVADQYERQASSIIELKFAEIGNLSADRETIMKFTTDAKFLSVGKSTFKANCVSCHGADGQGGIGPNLTDDAWKNVRSVEDIATVIEQGAANGAMPAWRDRLSHPNLIVLTAAYIASLRGSTPSGAKAAEGRVIPAWEDIPAKNGESTEKTSTESQTPNETDSPSETEPETKTDDAF